ncbi:MAG: hypothetical protein ACFFE8_07030 [Candidatus Heimdallarchaeota archaeon]
MGINADYSFLEYFPTQLFSALIEEWTGQDKKIDFTPNGLLSPDNRETTIRLAQSISSNRLKELQRLSRFLDFSDIWWLVYHIPRTKQVSNLLELDTSSFDVDKYSPQDGPKINGRIIVHELSEHAVFVALEFQSRSKFLRRAFRHLYLPFAKIILVEPQDQAIEVLENELLPFITQEPNKLAPRKANARFIKKLAKPQKGDGFSLVLTHLKIKITLETSGIEGLTQIIIQGSDVIRGAETLEQRHEISLKFMNSGPWVGVGTEDFIIEVGKGVKIRRLERSSLKSLSAVLSDI